MKRQRSAAQYSDQFNRVLLPDIIRTNATPLLSHLSINNASLVFAVPFFQLSEAGEIAAKLIRREVGTSVGVSTNFGGQIWMPTAYW